MNNMNNMNDVNGRDNAATRPAILQLPAGRPLLFPASLPARRWRPRTESRMAPQGI